MRKPKGRKATATAGLSGEYVKLMEAHAGEGVSRRRVDTVLLDPELVDEGDAWTFAMMELEDGDPEPLKRMLDDSEATLPEWFRLWVRYLVDKYKLSLRQGKWRTVAPFATTAREMRIAEMVNDVRRLATKENIDEVAAATRLAKRQTKTQKAFDAMLGELMLALRDGRGSTYRMRKRKGLERKKVARHPG